MADPIQQLDPEVAAPIEHVIDDVVRYREATERLIEGLRRQVGDSETDVAIMRSGITMAEKMALSDSAHSSRELTRLLAEFEAARRDIRVSVTAALLAEGLSTTEIGSSFGVTRQLANRFAREARARF